MARLTRAMEYCLVAIFAIYLTFVVGQVVFRYLGIDLLFWSEELVRYLLVWSVLIGATIVTARNAHVRVDIVDNMLPPAALRWLEVVNTLILIAFAAVLCWAGILFVQRSGVMTASMLGVRMSLVYSVIPATAALDGLFLVARLILLLRGRPPSLLPADAEIDTSL
jgi:C4-dicarboxylate transporter DctQ subunit